MPLIRLASDAEKIAWASKPKVLCGYCHRGFFGINPRYCPDAPDCQVNQAEEQVSAPLVPNYRIVDRLRAELNHLTNKLNEHVDASKRRKGKELNPRTTSGGFVIGTSP